MCINNGRLRCQRNTHKGDYFSTICESTSAESDNRISSFLLNVVDDFYEIVPWCVRLDTYSRSHNLVSESLFQLSEVICLANRVRYNYVDF